MEQSRREAEAVDVAAIQRALALSSKHAEKRDTQQALALVREQELARQQAEAQIFRAERDRQDREYAEALESDRQAQAIADELAAAMAMSMQPSVEVEVEVEVEVDATAPVPVVAPVIAAPLTAAQRRQQVADSWAQKMAK